MGKSMQRGSEQAPASGPSEQGSAPSVRAGGLGNQGAVARAGLVGGSDRFGGDIGEVMAWMMGKATGVDSGETEDARALVKQTCGNLEASHEKLETLGKAADTAGLSDVAARVKGAAGTLEGAAGLAAGLKDLIEVREKLALVERLGETTVMVLNVDLRDESAADAFDAWFLTLGEVGEELADAGSGWGALLKPFATFVKLFGQYNLFEAVRGNMQYQGNGGPNGATLRELESEGLL